ncbi:unnamed protein product [Dimorphilus gyrociliatus]|uniref:Glycosyltransferase family 92 protein n=1 Tax=Dimorphilus gyrociliatus TaxID=2664684 RepID=A0A7I8VFS2_9ANNE|nr:unnamed protein product [Dimorphilus gyrociliatus]
MNFPRFTIIRLITVLLLLFLYFVLQSDYWFSQRTYILPKLHEKSSNRSSLPLKSAEWHIFYSQGTSLYVHRAIYDSRKFENWQSPCVTLYVLSNVRRVKSIGSIFCKYGNAKEVEAVVLWTNEAYRYPFTGLQEYVIHCPINVQIVPNRIKIRKEKEVAELTIEKPQPGNEVISVCVPITYGSFDTKQLIEWFEFLRFFGVRTIDITIWRVPDNVLKVFKYYEQQNVVFINKMELPFKVSIDSRQNKLKPSRKPYLIKAFMPMALNECFIMNHLRSKYVLSLDFDEHIIMNSSHFSSFHELIQSYEKPGLVQVELCKLRYDVSCNMKVDDKYFIFQHRYRQNISSASVLDNPKSFITTSNCPYIGNHFCVWYNEKSQKEFPKVKLHLAHIAHYRKWKTCGEELEYFELDDALLPFKSDLTARFDREMRKYQEFYKLN